MCKVLEKAEKETVEHMYLLVLGGPDEERRDDQVIGRGNRK